MMFERVYCINLARRAERWQEFTSGLPDDWPFPQPERFEAIDGERCPPPAWWNTSPGAWGCWRSHVAILKRCLNEGIDSVLILEDDAIFREGFTAKAEAFLVLQQWF